MKGEMSKQAVLGAKVAIQALGHILTLIYDAIIVTIANNLSPGRANPAVI